MKKVLAFLGLFVFALNLNGQIKVQQISNRDLPQGFFAPKDFRLMVGYDKETFRIGHSEGGNPYSLNGFRAGLIWRSKLFNIVSWEVPLIYRMGWMRDNNPDGYDYLKLHELGVQTAFMLSTGYRWKNNLYFTFSCGPKIDITISDEETTESSERKLKIDYIDGHFEKTENGKTTNGISNNHKQSRSLDIPISVTASFRYNWVGVYFSYDIGLVDRHTDTYYEYVGVSKDHTLKSNHISMGLQLFIPIMDWKKK